MLKADIPGNIKLREHCICKFCIVTLCVLCKLAVFCNIRQLSINLIQTLNTCSCAGKSVCEPAKHFHRPDHPANILGKSNQLTHAHLSSTLQRISLHYNKAAQQQRNYRKEPCDCLNHRVVFYKDPAQINVEFIKLLVVLVELRNLKALACKSFNRTNSRKIFCRSVVHL